MKRPHWCWSEIKNASISQGCLKPNCSRLGLTPFRKRKSYSCSFSMDHLCTLFAHCSTGLLVDLKTNPFPGPFWYIYGRQLSPWYELQMLFFQLPIRLSTWIIFSVMHSFYVYLLRFLSLSLYGLSTCSIVRKDSPMPRFLKNHSYCYIFVFHI